MGSVKPSTLQHNKELAAIFHGMARCYQYLGKEERFRAIAYDNASKTLANLSEPVDALSTDIRKLDELKGVGESIAQKIVEYLQSGRIATYEKLKTQVPFDLLELMEVEGIGPATVRALHDALHVESRAALALLLSKGLPMGIKGLTAAKLSNIKKVLKLPETKSRMPLKDAQKIGNIVVHEVKEIMGVHRSMLAGSLRRQKETVGDIDVLISAPRWLWKRIIKKITTLPMVKKVLAAGQTKASVIVSPNNVQVDVRIVHNDEWGAALLYFTGSKEHNIALRSMAKQRGWKINEYGVFNMEGKKLAGETEEGIYQLFGMRFIPPEQRLGRNEIEQAMQA